MRTYLVAMKLVAQGHHQPESAIADAPDGISLPICASTPGSHAALVDWAVAGDDMAASIASVPVTDDYRPDDTPSWPGRTIP